MLIPRLLVKSHNQLGECIRWHPELERLFWVDIHQAQLWSADEDGGDVRMSQLPERIAAFSFSQNPFNLLISLVSGLAIYNLKNDSIKRLNEFEPQLADTRLNDGNTDPYGNFVTGGMDEDFTRPLSSVIQVTPQGRVKTLIKEVGCSNSICFSPEGKYMYFADTFHKDIWRFHYDAENGMVSNKTLLTRLTDEDGLPDGSCVDRDGNIWNAQHKGGQVKGYRPDGTVLNRIKLPVSNVTCCCIGGRSGKRMFITTAWDGMSDQQKVANPHAGGLFCCDLDVQGTGFQVFGNGLDEEFELTNNQV